MLIGASPAQDPRPASVTHPTAWTSPRSRHGRAPDEWFAATLAGRYDEAARLARAIACDRMSTAR
jgi:hypothetical protein